ncbi:MAG: glycosyltransferase family 39 protein, partial [Planctomycetes bacterium]|nr:glycosyltransferase family 39 protein [Planctomycetota bacterium]
MSRAAGAGAAPRAAMAAGGAATFALVVLLGLATPVPAEDGVSYFWMAQQFAAGAFAEALAMVFPPGWPLLLAPIVALGVSPEAAALLLSALTLALAAGPLVALAHELDPRAAWPAALLWASSPLLLRVAAEGYSEPPFVLLVAVGTWFGRRERFVAAGVCAGLAFWVRPEGLVLAASFVFVAPRAAWRALLPAGLCVLALATLRAALGLGSELLPLLTFHEQRDDLPGRGRVLANVLE